MSKPSVLIVGSSNTDMFIKVARLPKPGETILGGRFSTAGGGKGANQAVAAARAGGAVTLVARVGKDMFGDQAIAGFVADGINVDYVLRDADSPSGVALIFVGAEGENCIGVASGANANLSPDDLKKARNAFSEAGVVVMQLETPLKTVEVAARLAAKTGARVVLNPAPAQPLPDSLLQSIYLLTPNETEAELLTGVSVSTPAAAGKAAAVLRQRGVKNVIITMGARGAYVADDGPGTMLPSYVVKAVDATGAGDVFNGALAVALAEGKSLLDAARFAMAAAAISVTRPGAQPSAPSRKEIEDLLARGGNGQKRRPASPALQTA